MAAYGNIDGRATTPTVLFVDDTKWDSFFQLAATLRKSGVRCVRVTTVAQKASRIASRLVFDRCVYLPVSHQAETLRSVLRSENLSDIQFSENFAHLVGPCAEDLCPSLSSQVKRRIELMDKVRAAQLMERVGVDTPAREELNGPGLENFILNHGFPLVLKNRFGWGGHGVAIIDDREALNVRIESLGEAGDQYYVEQHMTGSLISYGAAVVDGDIMQEACYTVLETVGPLGPAMQLVTGGTVEALSLGRRIVRAAQCNGLMNIQFVQEAQGRSWPIDFNLRTFGPATNFQKAGLNFSEGYLRSLGLGTSVATTQAQAGVVIDGYPEAQRLLVRKGHLTKALVSFIVKTPENSRYQSLRYTILEAISFVTFIRDFHRQRPPSLPFVSVKRSSKSFHGPQ